MTIGPSPRDGFRERRAGYERERMSHARRSRGLSQGRSLAFMSGAGLLVVADVVEGRVGLWLAVTGILVLILFVGLVVLHRRSRRSEAWCETLAGLCDEGLARMERRWDDLPPDSVEPPPADHLFARDLDLFGRASVMQLLGMVGTSQGRGRLRGWLLEGGSLDALPSRQEAVLELGAMPGFREVWAATARGAPERGGDATEAVVRWAGARNGRSLPGSALWVARLVPVFTVVFLTIELVQPGGQPAWLLPLMISVWALRRWRVQITEVFAGAGVGESALSRRLDLVIQAESLDPVCPRLREVRDSLGRDREAASRGLRRLRQWVALAEVRLSQFHFPLNVLFLWDLHVAGGLEGWRRRWGSGVAGWIDGLAELDAVAALGALAHENPDWTLPRFADEPAIHGEGLGHPLLPPEACVRNDVSVGPPGTILVVTGSNMSGKSTLLRAIGVNAVLARAGSVVCAQTFSLPELGIATCMRVEDSLADGTSLFMAELERLKAVVEASTRPRPVGSTLFLLDEILHGTNTAERQVAARTVLRTLIASDSIGAVSTHDLELTDVPELREATVPVHFEEEVSRSPEGAPLIRFDYRLRPGPATSTNALTLLEVVGLRPPDSEPGSDAGGPAGSSVPAP